MTIKLAHFLVALACFAISLSASAQTLSPAQADSIHDLDMSKINEDFERAQPALQQALEYFKANDDECKISSLSRRLALCYEAKGQLDSALHVLLYSGSFAEKCSYNERLSHFLELSGMYITLENYEYVLELIDAFEQDWPADAPDSLLVDIQTNKAISNVYLGNISEAKRIFKTMNDVYATQGNQKRQIDALNNLGALYGMLDELDSSAYFLEIGAKICAEIKCNGQLELLQNLSTLAGSRKDYELAVMYIDSALSIARRTKNLKAETDLLMEISVATMNIGDIEGAWNYMYDHANRQDTLYNVQMAEAIANYQERFESEKKARKINALQVQKLDAELRESSLEQSRNIFLVGGLALLLFAVGLWSRLKYMSKTKSIIENEKNRSDELLLNILPFEVAQELKEKGTSEARDYDNVTVLFTDFQEFTETAEQLSAKDLVDEINVCFRAFDEIIQKHNIEKIKTIGDAYMAAGGLYDQNPSTPSDVVRACIEMQEFMTQRSEERVAQNLPAFKMRVGAHTGPVVAGIVGVKKFQYDIWGDTVNTASRMENAGEIGKVNISEATHALLQNDPQFIFENRGKIEVKGKGEMEMWFVALTSPAVV